jgi:TPP-dependent pyruvate/acetoin dehydrogenase alpha subunit
MNALFAELYGRKTGANGGKAGSQDISLGSVNFFSGAILAGATAISAGAALSFQNKNLPLVSVAGFGEGATDEGIFWETVNFASLRKLPLVLICENNCYATYSPQYKRTLLDNIAERVSKFGLDSKTIFGNDVVSVYLTIQEAVEHARSGQGPVFIEAYTYRWNSHVGPEDDGYIGYRPPEEMEFWKAHDSIKLVEEQLFANKLLDEAGKAALVQEIDREIAAAFDFAKSSPFPEIEDWTACNLEWASPLADKYLSDSTGAEFNQYQTDHIPAPY